MYYELEDNDSYYEDAGNLKEYPELPDGVSFNVGERIAVPLPTPLRFAMDPGWGRDMLLFMGSRVPVMRKDLIAALRDAGVDNIDAYDAVIYDPYTKRDVHDYQAVNVIGLVSAADLGASEYESFGEAPNMDTLFARVAVDEARARGALMFRLRESVTTVLVHERVKNQLAPLFPSLDFIPASRP